ncbi:MAG: DinB family protein [Thermoanaerobaculia bacterium]
MHSRLLGFVDHYLAEYQSKIERATSSLGEEDFWFRPEPRSNSIANLLLHLQGNLSLWVLEALCGIPAHRQRSAEFAARPGVGLAAGKTGPELVADLGRTVERCRQEALRLEPGDLTPRRTIQTYEVDGFQVLFHAVEHMSYHTGQIVLLAKLRLPAGESLEFYPQHRGE